MSGPTSFDLASFLAQHPRKRMARTKKVGINSEAEDIAKWFMDNFTPGKLMEILKDSRKEPINLEWYVKKLLKLYDHKETSATVKLQILDRFRDLILLGAIQDPELVASMRGKAPVQEADPFMGKKLKVRRGA